MPALYSQGLVRAFQLSFPASWNILYPAGDPQLHLPSAQYKVKLNELNETSSTLLYRSLLSSPTTCRDGSGQRTTRHPNLRCFTHGTIVALQIRINYSRLGCVKQVTYCSESFSKKNIILIVPRE
ncbi:hypothetical protein GDO81_002749 [Engystomops pustulosus]|uniref:Uncharacterized protein n=1 Tax=Engystomops pustulosus TaxID=76066 RepID=A0AAV7DP69_ENGPU|nr:hypothetical protein GDO81_002749 [Engystomops pustulosus]